MKQGNEMYANLKFDDEPFTPYQLALQELKKAKELNGELVKLLKSINTLVDVHELNQYIPQGNITALIKKSNP